MERSRVGSTRGSARGGGPQAAEVARRCRRPQIARNWAGTGEVKQGVGEPNSQMGKSYANSALERANQCSPSPLPRDWLAPEEGGVEPPGILALPIQVYASWLAPSSHALARSRRCFLASLFLGPTLPCVHAGDPEASAAAPPASCLHLPSCSSPRILKTKLGNQGAVKVLEGRQQYSPSIPKSK